jgi:hypothetical protein
MLQKDGGRMNIWLIRPALRWYSNRLREGSSVARRTAEGGCPHAVLVTEISFLWER